MDLLDGAVIVAVLLAAAAGYRRGLTLVGTAAAGLLLGLAGGALAATVVPPTLRSVSPAARSAIAVGLLLAGLVVGNLAGRAVGWRLRRSALRTRLGLLDSGLGSAFAAATALLCAWFLGLTFVGGPLAPLSRQIQGSAILRGLDARVPRPPGVFAALEQLLAGVPVPQVFVDLVPTLPPPVALPRSLLGRPGVLRGVAETVRVISTGCGGVDEGSGFPVARDRILTNAHVVAGAGTVVVQPPGRGTLGATVVLFDPRRDLALLAVPELGLAPLHLAGGAARGAVGAVVGYPGGGRERVAPAAVRGTLLAVGRDIYAQTVVTRQIEVLDADIRPGNSGGPLISLAGRVLGVVFARSTVTPDLGFALSGAEVAPDLARASSRTARVSTRGCVP